MEQKTDLLKSIKAYVANTENIRRLSSIDVSKLQSENDYADVLRDNFAQIREISQENKRILDEVIMPVFHSDGLLTEEQVDALNQFKEMLIDAYSVENLDLAMTSQLVDRMFLDAQKKADLDYLINQLDAQIETYYSLSSSQARIKNFKGTNTRYLDKADVAYSMFQKMIEHDNFAGIENMESRELVMINYRYMAAIFETVPESKEANRRALEQYGNAYQIMQDDFYKELLPDYDWKYNEERLLEYYGTLTEVDNRRALSKEQLQLCYEYSEILRKKWYEEPVYYKNLILEGELRLIIARNRYLMQKMTMEEYKKELLSIYSSRNPFSYSTSSISMNLLVPTELLAILQDVYLTEEEEGVLLQIYRNVLSYAHHFENSNAVSNFLNYYMLFLDLFIEVSDEFTFEEMCLDSFAALHPPTYIHSNMVAKFSRSICKHLLEEKPELFVGVCGTKTVEEVQHSKKKILNRIYHAALVHDVGKLSMIDIVFIYGRKLTDEEFDAIRRHPDSGYSLAEDTCLDTYKYIIRAHHRFYNEQGGYPEKSQEEPTEDKILIDIISIADCMDAATDSVGRSYAVAKNFNQFYQELVAEKGTRYNPHIVDSMGEVSLQKDLQYLLREGRNKTYSDTYHLLVGVSAKGATTQEEKDVVEEFREFLKKKARYETAIELLNYDLCTIVPEKGVEAEVETVAMLSMELKKFLTSAEAESLFRRLAKRPDMDLAMQESYERLLKKMEEDRRVPNDFYAEYVRERGISTKVWEQAKAENDFSIFAPHPEKIIQMTKKYCYYQYPDKDVYDVLLDKYEKGVDKETVERLFVQVKEGLQPLLKTLENKKPFDRSKVQFPVDVETQKKVCKFILEYIGFDFERGLMGESVHPFAARLNEWDVRITNSYVENDIINNMFSAIHEGGHGIFDQSIGENYFNTQLASVDLMGLHESQSRFFENILARNINFWTPIYDKLQDICPELKKIPLDVLEQAILDVRPSHIRIMADEVTYCLHIILRYEMEKAIFSDNIPVNELPALWNQKSIEILGIEPENDGEGILQDMHWADGSFGYFPSYLLGSIYGGMLLQAAKKELGDLEVILKEGRILEITNWLKKNIYQHGGLYTASEVMERICHKQLDASDLLEYFYERYGEKD